MSPTSTLPEWFARAIQSLQAGDIDGYMEIYAPDAVHEFPFAPEGAIRRRARRDRGLHAPASGAHALRVAQRRPRTRNGRRVHYRSHGPSPAHPGRYAEGSQLCLVHHAARRPGGALPRLHESDETVVAVKKSARLGLGSRSRRARGRNK